MSKKRSIDSRIRHSPKFVSLSYRQRDLWHGLIAMADDQGRLLGLTNSIRSTVFPLEDPPLVELEDDLNCLIEMDMILRYESDGREIIQIFNWWKYQKHQWAGPSDFNPPPGWRDRKRYHGSGHKIIQENWDTPGGFVSENEQENINQSNDKSPDKSPNKSHDENVENQVSLKVKVNDKDNIKVKEGNSGDKSPPIPINLQEWHEKLKNGSNKPAILREMVEVLYPDAVEYPDFSYLGSVAKRVKGAGRLATLMWECSSRKPSGDILAYVQAYSKGDVPEDEDGEEVDMEKQREIEAQENRERIRKLKEGSE